MSAKENKPFQTPIEEPKSIPEEKDVKPMTIMSSQDAYIAERMKSQPKTLDDIELNPRVETNGIHRLSLPEYFESQAYDCSRGQTCKFHAWSKRTVMYGLDMEMDRWEQTKHGKYIFRWLNKNKRALDQSLNVKDWNLVNRSYFSDAPKILFSINGGVENGDTILAFMPVKKALFLRTQPSIISQDRAKGEETKYESHPNFYKAKLGPEKDGEGDYAPADALQEGRDFNV